MNFHRSFYEWHENGSKIGKRMGKMPKWMMTLFKLTQHAVLIDVSEADSFNRQMAFYPLTTLCATYKEKDSWYTEGKQRTSYLFQMPCKNKGRGLYRHMTNSYSPRTVAFLKQTRNVGGITNFTYWWFGFSFFSSWSVEHSNSYLSRELLTNQAIFDIFWAQGLDLWIIDDTHTHKHFGWNSEEYIRNMINLNHLMACQVHSSGPTRLLRSKIHAQWKRVLSDFIVSDQVMQKWSIHTLTVFLNVFSCTFMGQ